MIRRILFFAMAVILSIGTCSQAGTRQGASASGGGQDAFEVKRSILFENGSLDEFIETRWDSGFNRVDFEERFPASGGYVEPRTNLRLGYIEQIEFAYNDKGLMTTKLTRDTENRQKSRVTYQYDQNDRLIRETVQEVIIRDPRRPPEFRAIATYEFTYEGNRRNPSKRVHIDRTNNQLAETIYTYNAQNNLTASETRVDGTVIGSTTFSYDGNGNRIREEARDNQGNVTTTAITWRDGNEINRVVTGPNRSIQLRVTNEFGQNNQMTKSTIENIQGSSTQIIVYEYTLRPTRR